MKSLLDDCRVNDVIGLTYGDTAEERICRVVGVRDTHRRPLSPASIRRRPHVERGQFLITCQDTNGKIKSFYSGVEKSARLIPPLKVAFMYLRGKLPARKRLV